MASQSYLLIGSCCLLLRRLHIILGLAYKPFLIIIHSLCCSFHDAHSVAVNCVALTEDLCGSRGPGKCRTQREEIAAHPQEAIRVDRYGALIHLRPHHALNTHEKHRRVGRCFHYCFRYTPSLLLQVSSIAVNHLGRQFKVTAERNESETR